ncbi:MAG: hydrolase [Acidobacteriota bacterium]|nr:hydrolase [Acidobacteriota bacterium]
MTPSERNAVVAEARSWLRTPYHHRANIKGSGADCALFPLAVYTSVLGLVAPPLPPYVQQFNLHSSEEKYLTYVREFGAREIQQDEVQPGDFALWRIGRCYSHGAIVLEWPNIIHAVNPRGVILGNASSDENLSRTAISRPLFFTF